MFGMFCRYVPSDGVVDYVLLCLRAGQCFLMVGNMLLLVAWTLLFWWSICLKQVVFVGDWNAAEVLLIPPPTITRASSKISSCRFGMMMRVCSSWFYIVVGA